MNAKIAAVLVGALAVGGIALYLSSSYPRSSPLVTDPPPGSIADPQPISPSSPYNQTTDPQGRAPGGEGAENPPPDVGIPACNSAPFDEHYKLAAERLAVRYPNLRIVRESAEEVGPCNNLNTASSQFDVVGAGGVTIGTIAVNGDTKVVTLKTSQGSESL